MTERTFYVTANGAIALPGGRLLQPGSRVRESMIPQGRVQEWLAQGWLSESPSQAKLSHPGREQTGARSRRRQAPPAVGSPADLSKSDAGSQVEDVPGASAAARRALESARKRADSAALGFAHDPDGLVGKPVADLREMILAVDPGMEVNGLDEGELISILSSEYEAPAGPATELASALVRRDDPA